MEILMKKIVSLFLALILSVNPVIVHADVLAAALQLPAPGVMVGLSEAFTPSLLRGMIIHPDKPLQFDFIVDHGDSRLEGDAFSAESQRMVNYFLASLTTPQKDLWVNLSPVEQDRIIPDALIRTELGRDLLAQDYMLKQITASLIYPESDLGKGFWKRIYDEAYQKFGVTEIPVDVFNKVWIVPQTASVFEKGNAVYIVSAHLKVMLEADYFAQGAEGNKEQVSEEAAPVEGLSKQVLREVIVPAIEKEVNQGKNFAKLRQVVYAMVLAQWYLEVLKESVLNKVYSGRNKVAGIDLSDPKNKEVIYQQYMDAYKKGVFNYIKEENDRVTNEPVPKKYFSGGFQEQPVARTPVTEAALGSSVNDTEVSRVMVEIGRSGEESQGEIPQADAPNASQKTESHQDWSSPDRPIALLEELRDCWKGGGFDRARMLQFLAEYSPQVERETDLYPVEAPWPVFKAFALLTKAQKKEMVQALQEEFQGKKMTPLVEGLLLVNNIYSKDWVKGRTPHLLRKQVYLIAAEIHHWAGGLGPVMKFLGKMMKELGVNAAYIAPWYQNTRENGKTVSLDYFKNAGVTITNEDLDEFQVEVGDLRDENLIHHLNVKVAEGIDENGVTVYMFKDVGADGKSRYTNMLYNYDQEYNYYLTKEESMAFINVASAKLLLRLEEKRKREDPKAEPAVVHSNDGQFAPLQAVTMSWYGRRSVIKDIVWAFTTHTYLNRGNNDNVSWGIGTFLKHMMGVTGRYVNAFRQYKRFGPKDGSLTQGAEFIDHTSGGVGLADVVLAVAGQHRDRVAQVDSGTPIRAATNGAAPEEMAKYLNLELKAMGADLEDPTAAQIAQAKRASKKNLNEAGIKRHNGKIFHVDEDAVLIGCARRGVFEKSGIYDAFTRRNLYRLAQGILDRKHLEIKFAKLSLDGGSIFDWLLRSGYLKTVAVTQEGRYYDTEKEYSATEGRLYGVDMSALRSSLEKEYPGKARQIFDVLQRVLNRRKASVGPFLNDQGGGSVGVLRYFGPLEMEIEKAKAESPDQFPGDFQLVSSFVAENKKRELSGADADVKSSWLGANEVTEEDIAANGGIQIGTDEGAIIRQGIRLTEDHPGNVLPASSEDGFWESFLTILEMTPEELSENQRVSYQLGRTVMLAVRTAGVNAEAYEDVLARRERESKADTKARVVIVDGLKGDGALVKSILEQGRNGVKASFVFQVKDQGRFPADEANKLNGLRSFIEKKNALEEIYGYDSLLGHFKSGDFQRYLLELFSKLDSVSTLRDWLAALDKGSGTEIEKYKRFGRFLEDLEAALEDRVTVITVDQAKAKFLLGEAGGQGMNFIWRSNMGNELDRNGPGLLAFVDAFDRIQERRDREDVLRFHSMNGSSHILTYLRDILKTDPLMAGLQYKVEQMLALIGNIPANHVEERIDLTFQMMAQLRHYTGVLEKIADPAGKTGTDPVDVAATADTGGIDARNIGVDRRGDLVPGVLSDRALEEVLMNTPGLRGVIVSITPIVDLPAILK